MAIKVNLDVMLARRKMSSGQLAELVGITQANLSILKTGKAKAIRFSTLDAICKALGADTYFSGRGASVDYLDREKFAENGVNIVFQDFAHPTYSQCGRDAFVPGVSILDILFSKVVPKQM